MSRLTLLMFTVIAPTFTGICILIALVTGNDTLSPILIAAACGFVGSVPLTYFIAKKISQL